MRRRSIACNIARSHSWSQRTINGVFSLHDFQLFIQAPIFHVFDPLRIPALGSAATDKPSFLLLLWTVAAIPFFRGSQRTDNPCSSLSQSERRKEVNGHRTRIGMAGEAYRYELAEFRSHLFKTNLQSSSHPHRLCHSTDCRDLSALVRPYGHRPYSRTSPTVLQAVD